MKRREFIIVIVIGGTAAAWSLAASAERAARVPPVKQIRLTERQIHFPSRHPLTQFAP
jgi:hypothetical protein